MRLHENISSFSSFIEQCLESNELIHWCHGAGELILCKNVGPLASSLIGGVIHLLIVAMLVFNEPHYVQVAFEFRSLERNKSLRVAGCKACSRSHLGSRFVGRLSAIQKMRKQFFRHSEKRQRSLPRRERQRLCVFAPLSGHKGASLFGTRSNVCHSNARAIVRGKEAAEQFQYSRTQKLPFAATIQCAGRPTQPV